MGFLIETLRIVKCHATLSELSRLGGRSHEHPAIYPPGCRRRYEAGVIAAIARDPGGLPTALCHYPDK